MVGHDCWLGPPPEKGRTWDPRLPWGSGPACGSGGAGGCSQQLRGAAESLGSLGGVVEAALPLGQPARCTPTGAELLTTLPAQTEPLAACPDGQSHCRGSEAGGAASESAVCQELRPPYVSPAPLV